MRINGIELEIYSDGVIEISNAKKIVMKTEDDLDISAKNVYIKATEKIVQKANRIDLNPKDDSDA